MSAALNDQTVPADRPSPLTALRNEYANLSLPLGSTREAAQHERDTALYYIDRILDATHAPDAGLRDHETCVPHDHVEPDPEKWERDQAAAIASSPAPAGSGVRTECSLVGVHEHAFRGPHTFDEWYDGQAPAPAGLDVDIVRGLNDAARTLIEALDRHGLGNLALFEQQVEHLRGHLLIVAEGAATRPAEHVEAVWGPDGFHPGYGKGVCAVDGEPWPCRAATRPAEDAGERP